MLSGGNTNVDKATSVGNYLALYFGQDQGVRLGESTVVSRKAHAKMPEKRVKGQIQVLLNRDAGKTYLDFVDIDQVVHIDIYHKPGEIDPIIISQAIFFNFEQYILERDPLLKYDDEERFRIISEYMHRIYITSNKGKGVMYELYQGLLKPFTEEDEGLDHVHILARFNREDYYLVYVIAEAVEETILNSGVKLAKVRNLSHGNQKQVEENFAGYIKLPWKNLKGQRANALPDKENVNQLIMKLAEKFGGVDEIEEFMESYSTNIFKRKGIEQQKKKWGDVEHYVEQLEELGLLKNTPIGTIMTRRGLQLTDYVIKHKCEVETEIRKNMRKIPAGGTSRFRRVGQIEPKSSSSVELINRSKTINDPEGKAVGDLAVPETIVQAFKNSFMRGDERFTIKKEDLHYYQKKTYTPIDICLLIDASGSMAGDKRQAACYLAEHLLLTGKERVSVITFQERSSDIVVPFTRDHNLLRKGLATISPAGLTPMASGIVTAVKSIKENRARNPLLVMITDGIPNTPLWTLDATADALEAATFIPEANIHLVCIGVESNRIFLEKLSNRADGVLYLVDDLNKDNLINIVRHEKKSMLNPDIKMA